MFVVEQNLSACQIAIEFFIDHDFYPSPSVAFSIEDVKKKLVKLTEIILFESPRKNESFSDKHFSEVLLYIIFASNKRVHSLNKNYRGFDNPTDVLTFTYEDHLSEAPHGEIYMSTDMAIKQSREHGLTLSEELCLLSVHGILHALGLDHEKSTTEAFFMRKHETELLEMIGLNHVYPLTCIGGA